VPKLTARKSRRRRRKRKSGAPAPDASATDANATETGTDIVPLALVEPSDESDVAESSEDAA
jgi:hypothetical protein